MAPRCWATALQVALQSCFCPFSVTFVAYRGGLFLHSPNFSFSTFTCSAISLPTPSVSKILKLCFLTCQLRAHLAASSFISTGFFRIAPYPQKRVTLLWCSFSCCCFMTLPSALTSYLPSSLLESVFPPFSRDLMECQLGFVLLC